MLIDKLVKRMVEKGASDLHLAADSPPVLRIDGKIVWQGDLAPLTVKDIEAIFEQITSPNQRQIFASEMELDCAYTVPEVARLRINVLQQRGIKNLACRLVPSEIPTIDGLGLPQICKELIRRPRGLVLVTGPTGCGKSTTLAAMIDHLNDNDERNVIIIEDPIEYLHRNRKCLIAQRDFGGDTKSFSSALIHALRHDPDVIVIGEMRDLKTISAAITAAETGHLVLSTLHTRGAGESVSRIVDFFPTAQQEQIRMQLAEVLLGVISQVLLRRTDGKGRIAAFEVMAATAAIKNLIRENKMNQIATFLETGRQAGMQPLKRDLERLLTAGLITAEEARASTSA